LKDYHSYVFDLENREFVGKFDEMYQAESEADSIAGIKRA